MSPCINKQTNKQTQENNKQTETHQSFFYLIFHFFLPLVCILTPRKAFLSYSRVHFQLEKILLQRSEMRKGFLGYQWVKYYNSLSNEAGMEQLDCDSPHPVVQQLWRIAGCFRVSDSFVHFFSYNGGNPAWNTWGFICASQNPGSPLTY